MSKQLHKSFNDAQVKSLLKSYLDKKSRLIISSKCLVSREVDSLNRFPDTEKIFE